MSALLFSPPRSRDAEKRSFISYAPRSSGDDDSGYFFTASQPFRGAGAGTEDGLIGLVAKAPGSYARIGISGQKIHLIYGAAKKRRFPEPVPSTLLS
jgi:hypothetical protein